MPVLLGLGKGTDHAEVVPVCRAFTIVELLVVIAIVAVLAALGLTALPGLQQRADRADALAKTRTMGRAVLSYVPDHAGKLPPLWPGQVLEFQEGRRKRIVTECADYLGLAQAKGSFLVSELMPRAYARAKVPTDHAQMRVYVMNEALANATNNDSLTLASVAGIAGDWMMSTADQDQPNVVSAPWKANTPPQPPLGEVRAVFRFDGSAGLVNIDEP